MEKIISKISDDIRGALYQDEDYRRAQKIIEETIRQDGKKLADLGVEAANQRKRVDENKARLDMNTDSITKIDNRLNDCNPWKMSAASYNLP